LWKFHPNRFIIVKVDKAQSISRKKRANICFSKTCKTIKKIRLACPFVFWDESGEKNLTPKNILFRPNQIKKKKKKKKTFCEDIPVRNKLLRSLLRTGLNSQSVINTPWKLLKCNFGTRASLSKIHLSKLYTILAE